MGQLFGDWGREEEEDVKASGLSVKEYYKKKKFEYDNRVLTYTKKCARFRGVYLEEDDIIEPSINSNNQYYIIDFVEGGRPLVKEIDGNSDNVILYPHEEVVKVVSYSGMLKPINMKSTFKIDFADLSGNGIEPIIRVTIGDETVEDKLLRTLFQSANSLKVTYVAPDKTNGEQLPNSNVILSATPLRASE